MAKKRKRKKDLTCNSPDWQGSGLVCGYPLPCPYHTAIIDVSGDIPELRIPITAKNALKGKHHLEDIAAILLIDQ